MLFISYLLISQIKFLKVTGLKGRSFCSKIKTEETVDIENLKSVTYSPRTWKQEMLVPLKNIGN